MSRIGLSVFALAWIAGAAYVVQLSTQAVKTTCPDPPPPGGVHRTCEVAARSFEWNRALVVHIAGAVLLTVAAAALWRGRRRLVIVAAVLGMAALAPATWEDLVRPVAVP
jgi:NAD(P)-dependent dehydrogenase (short-subunit alcohol dehydrogenase family)